MSIVAFRIFLRDVSIERKVSAHNMNNNVRGHAGPASLAQDRRQAGRYCTYSR